MKVSKIILTGKEARKKLLDGVNKVADIVGKTMGPNGRNVIMGTIGTNPPKITNDGVTIAQEIIIDDEVENIGARAVINAAKMTNDRVGDGTSTCTILAREIVREGILRIDDEHALIESTTNVMDLYRELNQAKDTIVEMLNKSAKPLKLRKDIKKIALTSVENEEIAEIMTEMLSTLGKEAVITVEPGYNHEIEHEIIKGMRIDGTYASDLLITNDRKEAIKKDIDVVVTNHRIENPNQLMPLVTKLAKAGKTKLVVASPFFAKEVMPTIVVNKVQGRFDILAVKVPALTDQQLEDMAVYVGGKFINQNVDDRFEDVELLDLGFVHQIIVNDSDAVLIGGKGDPTERLEFLREEMKQEKTEMMRTKYERRIASLSGAIGVIRVGAKSDIERKYLKDKVDDAIYATKAAMEMGVVEGGGLALKHISDKLPKGNILKDVILRPYEQIQENSGSEFIISDDVLDPVKVTIVALENAVSVAGILLTTDTVIADRQIKDIDESFRKLISDNFEEDNG